MYRLLQFGAHTQCLGLLVEEKGVHAMCIQSARRAHHVRAVCGLWTDVGVHESLWCGLSLLRQLYRGHLSRQGRCTLTSEVMKQGTQEQKRSSANVHATHAHCVPTRCVHILVPPSKTKPWMWSSWGRAISRMTSQTPRIGANRWSPGGCGHRMYHFSCCTCLGCASELSVFFQHS